MKSEFPNRYAFLIYVIFSSLRGWVRDASHLPGSQSNVVLKRVDSQHENENIPKSSIKALCESLFHATVSENLGERQKHSLSDMIFELFFEIKQTSGFQDYATVLLHCIQDVRKYESEAPEFEELLRTAFSEQENEYRIKHEWADVDELQQFLATFMVGRNRVPPP